MADDEDDNDDMDSVGGNEDYNDFFHDRIIFLIDGRSKMVQCRTNQHHTHLQNCLALALAVMKSKVIANENTMIGITFFGTSNASTDSTADGIYRLFSLAQPNAMRIRELQGLVEDPALLLRTIKPQAADTQTCPLREALWSTSCEFSLTSTKDKKKRDIKRLWVFTNDDCPNASDRSEQKATMTAAKDLADASIDISLWYLHPSAVRPFDPSLFYIPLLKESAPAISTDRADDADAFDDMEDEVMNRVEAAGEEGFDLSMVGIRRKDYRKRKLGAFLCSLFNDCGGGAAASTTSTTSDSHSSYANSSRLEKHMAVGIYKTIQIMKKPSYTWLYARTAEPVKATSKLIDSGTGEVVDASRIATFFEIAGSKVSVSTEELAIIKRSRNVEGVGMQMLYFMPLTELRLDLQVESSYFIYPDEALVKGSSALFQMLLTDLIEKKLCAVVRFNRNFNAPAVMAALIPQLEKIDTDDGTQIEPPGFHMLIMPFVEDVRSDPTAMGLYATDSTLKQLIRPEQLDAAVQVVDRLSSLALPMSSSTSSSYSSSYRDIQSPAVQQYYSVIQAVALNHDKLEWDHSTDDQLRPDPSLLLKYSADFEHFKNLMGLVDDQLNASSSKVSS